MAKEYYNKRNKDNILCLRGIIKELPYFCDEFFVGIEQVTTPLTRLNYAYDLKNFFTYLVEKYEYDVATFNIGDLNRLTASHIEGFLSYLSFYTANNRDHSCGERAKSRKLSTLRTFFKYFFNKDKISANVASKVQMPKIHDKAIIRLETDEVSRLINLVECGDGLTEREKAYHSLTKVRDIAILILFLGTGIRVSECVGLNVNDVDFNTNSILVTRKGGNQTVLYFSEEVADALREHIDERQSKLNSTSNKGSTKKAVDNALFLSMQNKRMSVRAVQNLVLKYSSIISPLKKITPHKLRSTFGTSLYSETKDIYIVADVLGHKDVNTTKKHYAAISDEMRRSVAGKVKLRDRTED